MRWMSPAATAICFSLQINAVAELRTRYLDVVQTFADTLVARGTDHYGTEHSPLFASLLDLKTREIPSKRPPAIQGQRESDRAWPGGNLQHDILTLETMYHLSALTNEKKYAQAADACLRWFLTHCAKTPTGLWPWGEHAFWDFQKEAIANPIHEYLGSIPTRMWERMVAINPQAVRGEADGLFLYHFRDKQNFGFNRHANIVKPDALFEPNMDFPRHGGFYMELWALLYKKTGERKYADWCIGLADHFWRKRDPETGLVNAQASDNLSWPQSTLSLGISMFIAHDLAGEALPDFPKQAAAHLEQYLRVPHRPAECKIFIAVPMKGGDPTDFKWLGNRASTAPFWDSNYGSGGAEQYAMMACQAYRRTRDPRFLKFAEDTIVGFSTQAPCKDINIPARVYGVLISLCLDLHELADKSRYLELAEQYAAEAIDRYFAENLFRGATGLDYYEAELGVEDLAYGLLHLHVVKAGAALPMAPNYTDR
jgi:hypothetical protein